MKSGRACCQYSSSDGQTATPRFHLSSTRCQTAATVCQISTTHCQLFSVCGKTPVTDGKTAATRCHSSLTRCQTAASDVQVEMTTGVPVFIGGQKRTGGGHQGTTLCPSRDWLGKVSDGQYRASAREDAHPNQICASSAPSRSQTLCLCGLFLRKKQLVILRCHFDLVARLKISRQ